MTGLPLLPTAARALPPLAPPDRRLHLINGHTGETFYGPYRDKTGPIAAAMADLSALLRDFHSAETIGIDVAVIDFLVAILDATGADKAIILSAYRTVETNARLARTTFGVAENSQHLYGRALDLRLENRLPQAMRAARAMRRGGVGWYPRSGFLHIDTGPVRNWDLEETGLGSLLAGTRHLAPGDRNPATNTDHSRGILPEAEHIGRPLPGYDRSGHPRPEMDRRGHILARHATAASPGSLPNGWSPGAGASRLGRK